MLKINQFSGFGTGGFVGAGGGGATPIDPATLANLAMWLKADAVGGGLANDDPVVTWEDAHTSNKDATQGTAGKRPVYKTNIINGLPVVRFDASDDSLETTLALTAPYSIFLVYAHKGAGSAARRVLNDVVANVLVGPYSGKHDFYDGSFRTGAPAVVQDAFVYVSLIVGAANTAFYVDGTLIDTKANGTNSFFGLRLGTSGANNEPADSDVAEVIVTSQDSGADRAGVEEHLKQKYAL
jgi:hypothetical protein